MHQCRGYHLQRLVLHRYDALPPKHLCYSWLGVMLLLLLLADILASVKSKELKPSDLEAKLTEHIERIDTDLVRSRLVLIDSTST